MNHRGACQGAQSYQEMCADTTVDLRIPTTSGHRIADSPTENKRGQQGDVREDRECQKNSFHRRESPGKRHGSFLLDGLIDHLSK
jgi:hypothetical protein